MDLKWQTSSDWQGSRVNMIIDSHAYCFLAPDSSRGYESSQDHLNWVQAAHASHHQPAFRTIDRQVGPSDVLAPKRIGDFSSLPDLSFRIDHSQGRVLWDYEGQEYTKHFYPPGINNCEFSPHSLITEMDYAGVDLAILHTDPMLVRDSSYLQECISQYPTRFMAMTPVDEWRIHKDIDQVISEVNKGIKDNRLHAIKFNPFGYNESSAPWDGGVYKPFWDSVTDLDVPIFFTLGNGPVDTALDKSDRFGIEGYLGELRILLRWMESYPDSVCSLTHGFPWRLFIDGDKIVLPEEIWEPFKGDNCNLEVCFPVRLGDLFDFPYRAVWPVLDLMVRNIGSDHLLWGTDMPFQNRFCTYRQSREWIEKYCKFLGRDDIDSIMGDTAARIMKLDN